LPIFFFFSVSVVVATTNPPSASARYGLLAESSMFG
jgi:hypothetical protein